MTGSSILDLLETTMQDDNSMDVDNAPRTPPRFIFKDISQYFPTSPSLLSLLQAEVDKFKLQLTAASRSEDWPASLISAENDEEKLNTVKFSCFFCP